MRCSTDSSEQSGQSVLMVLFVLIGMAAVWGIFHYPPVKVVAVMLGVLCMVLATWKIEVALYGIGFFLVVLQEAETTPGTLFEYLERLNRPNIPSLLEVLFAVLGAAFCFRYLLIRDERYSFDGMKGPLLLYFLLLLVALANGIKGDTDYTYRKEDLKRFIFPTLVFVSAFNILDTREKAMRLLKVMFWVMLAKTYIADFYYLKGMGFPYEDQLVVFLESGDQILVVTVIVTSVAVLAEQRLRMRSLLFMLWGLSPMLFALIFSYRRNALLGAIISLSLLMLLSRGAQKIRIFRMLMAVGLCASALMALRPTTNSLSTSEFLQKRLLSIVDQDQSSNVAHKNEWRLAVADTMRRPLLGLGLGSEHAQDPEFPSINLHTVHNGLIMLWMKMGFISVLLFFWCMYRYLRLGVTQALRSRDPLLTGLFATAGLWLISMNVGPAWFYYRESCLVALMMAVVGKLATLEPDPATLPDQEGLPTESVKMQRLGPWRSTSQG